MYSSVGERKVVQSFRSRLYTLSALMAIAFLLLLGQLINLQLIHGKQYQMRSRANMETFVPIPAPRGLIYDRHYEPFGPKDNSALVKNRASFNIYTLPAKYPSSEELDRTISALHKYVGFSIQKIRKAIKEQRNPYEPVFIKRDADFDTVVRIATLQDKFSKVRWQAVPKRNYSFGPMYAHALGYTGKISKGEYKKRRQQGYKHYHILGKVGIEKEYDRLLRGKDGRIRKIVDVRRRTEGAQLDREPLPGKVLVMTLNHKIQKLAFDASKKLRGTGAGVIVLKPATGEILALVSRPTFDPNQMISIEKDEDLQALLEDKNKPLLNRAIQIKNPPSSTFKPLVALTALEENKVDPQETFFCNHKYVLEGKRDRTFYCWSRHGRMDMVSGIAKSCNVYFYNIGLRLGSVPILNYARYFGLNKKTNIDLPGETRGFVPSDSWKRKTFNQRWFDGDTLNISIGQGFLQVTPIGLAAYYAGLVNDGVIYQPHLLKEVRNPVTKKVEFRVKPKIMREVPVNKDHLDTVRKGLRAVVTRGTARFMKSKKIPIAGKTGTVQTVSITKEREHMRHSSERQHAWFVGYAPYDAPVEEQVLVAVFVQYGHSGSGGAAPIAWRIFRGIFGEQAEK